MSSETTDKSKSELRKHYREARRAIDIDLRAQNDQIIGAQIEACTARREAVRIAGYLAFDGEPDISGSLARMNNNRVEVNLPVISADVSGPSMIFRRWHPHRPHWPSSSVRAPPTREANPG